MNKLSYILSAKNQYSIQSPFLYDLHQKVIVPPLDAVTLQHLGIERKDRFSQLKYKLSDHYNASPLEVSPLPDLLSTLDADFIACKDDWIGIVKDPHMFAERERKWAKAIEDSRITLSVDIFYAGLLFSSKKLSKAHWMLTNSY